MNHFKFSIIELDLKLQSFSLEQDSPANIIEVIGEAAKLFFYAKEGYKEAWPLTFFLYDENCELISKANVFVLAALPRFDIIPYYLNDNFSQFYY